MITLPFSRPSYILEPLTAQMHAELAELHAQTFSRFWHEADFLSLLAQSNVFGFIARPVGKPKLATGFVLARLIVDEAEVLTISVDPTQQRRGVGRDLMEGVLRVLHRERAKTLFLEVDETNQAAQSLYRRLGFIEVGQRPNYYESETGYSGALILRKDVSGTV